MKNVTRTICCLLCCTVTHLCYAAAKDVYFGIGGGQDWWQWSRDTEGVLRLNNPEQTEPQHLQYSAQQTSMAADVGVWIFDHPHWGLAWEVEGEQGRQEVSDHYKTTYETYEVDEKVGWTLDSGLLPMIRLPWGLAAFTHIGLSTLNFSFESHEDGGGYYGPTGRESRWQPGWFTGGGVEQMLPIWKKHLSWRIDYIYRDYFPFTVSTVDPPKDPYAPNGDYLIDTRYHLKSQQLILSLQYNF